MKMGSRWAGGSPLDKKEDTNSCTEAFFFMKDWSYILFMPGNKFRRQNEETERE